MYMLVEMIVQVVDDFYLFLNDLGEHSVLNRKQARYSCISLLYLGLNAHPKRHSRDDLQHNAAQTPDIYDPWIFVSLHLF